MPSCIRRYAISLDAQPLSTMPQRCASLRKAMAPGFSDVTQESDYSYAYENVDCGTNLLQLHSSAIKLAQRIRLSKSPILTVQGDGGQVQKLHTFDIAVRYFNIETNTTHTEFLAMVNCRGTADEMCRVILEALGSDLIEKLVGGSFDVSAMHCLQTRAKQHVSFGTWVKTQRNSGVGEVVCRLGLGGRWRTCRCS